MEGNRESNTGCDICGDGVLLFMLAGQALCGWRHCTNTKNGGHQKGRAAPLGNVSLVLWGVTAVDSSRLQALPS